MFERRQEPLVSRRRFAVRVAECLGIAVTMDVLAVAIGAVGYHCLERLDWLTACANAAMVITGNGLITTLRTPGGKIFSIFDAVIGVLAFISVAGVILAPVFHRLLHSFHLEVGEK